MNASWNGRQLGVVDLEPAYQSAPRPRGWRPGTRRARSRPRRAARSRARSDRPRSRRAAAAPRPSRAVMPGRAPSFTARALDPLAVVRYQREQGALAASPSASSPSASIRSSTPSIACRLRPLDLGGRNPPRAEHATFAVDDHPVGGDPVAGCVLRACRRSGGPRPARPSPPRARRAGRGAGRTAARSEPRAAPGTRTPDPGGPSQAVRRLTRNSDTDRVPAGIPPASPPDGMSVRRALQLEPAGVGHRQHRRRCGAVAERDGRHPARAAFAARPGVACPLRVRRRVARSGARRARNRPSERSPTAHLPRPRRAC